MYYQYTFMKIKDGVQRSVQKSNFCLIFILKSHNIKNKDDLYYREIQKISQNHFFSPENLDIPKVTKS